MFPLGERKNLASLASAGETTVSVTAMLGRRERRMGRYYTRRAAIHTPGSPADASTAAVAAAVYARRSVNERRSEGEPKTVGDGVGLGEVRRVEAPAGSPRHSRMRYGVFSRFTRRH